MVSTSQVADAVETVAVSHAACSLLKLAVKGIPSLSFTTGRQLSASASIAVANGIAIDDTAVQVGPDSTNVSKLTEELGSMCVCCMLEVLGNLVIEC